jgi:hypothetical protein
MIDQRLPLAADHAGAVMTGAGVVGVRRILCRMVV